MNIKSENIISVPKRVSNEFFTLSSAQEPKKRSILDTNRKYDSKRNNKEKHILPQFYWSGNNVREHHSWRMTERSKQRNSQPTQKDSYPW